MTGRRIIWIAWAWAVGCGPRSDGDSGEEHGESGGDPSGEAGEEGETSDDPGELQWEPLAERHGWMQLLGTNAGAWIELDDAVLPATCDAALGAAEGSAGLAFASPSGDPADLEEAADLWAASEIVDIASIAPRPGLASVSPLFVTSVDAVVATTDAEPGFARWIDLDPAGPDPDPVYLDVCDTAFARGACVVPGPGFPFEGCIGVPMQRPEFTLTPTLVREGDDWVFSDDASYECETNVLAPGHPAELDVGEQTLRITAGELAEGVSVDVDADLVRWESSFKSAEACVDIEDKGSVCTCTWDYRETIAIDRATLMRQGERVLLDIKGAAGDAEYLFWGAFPIPS